MYFITSTIIGFQCRASAYGGTPELLRTTSSGGPARTYASRTATRSSSTQIRTTTTRGSVIVVTTTLSAEPVTSSSSDINDYIDSRINESRSDNTGAIVGGSIGGAAVLAISALAGVLFFRRRKKKNTDEVRSSQAVETMEASGANGPLAYYPASPSYPGSSYPVSPGGPVGTISTASTPHSPGLEDSHKTSLLTRGHNQNHRLSEVDGGAGSQVHELAAREGDTPFCHPVNYVATDSFHGFTCAKTAFSRGQRTALLQTTFSGATTTRNYGLFGATASGAAPGTGTDEDNAVEQISSPTDAGGGGSGGDRGDGGGGGDSQSSTPIGAIVGGVVGGISVIAIAAGAGAFVYRRKKKRSQDIGGQAVVQPENTDTRSPKWPLLNAGQAAKIPEYPLEMDAAVPATQVHELGDTGHPNSSPPARQVHELG
ncbi:hypothetical protein M9X92_005931 [Pyricularia oryzae]|nr:hypothetical protein M9X92_005931 [Pyricularia oryzae]